MKIEDIKNKVHCGDCVEVMKTMPENSVDTIITDPPAGISFMGKEWDKDKGGRDKWIEWLTEVMKECYRVAKPGSTALVWAIPRTSHWTATAIENAGWQIKDIIMHIFGSGFPKSTDISKQLDKGIERKMVGKKKQPIMSNHYGKGLHNQREVKELDITEPATPEAKLWNGWGTALKPAAEHWILAMKPNEGTYANNALKWGISGINIDGGRIGADIIKHSQDHTSHQKWKEQDGRKHKEVEKGIPTFHQGCFPANILLDEEAAKVLDEQSGERSFGNKSSGYSYKGKQYQVKGFIKDNSPQALSNYGDKGGASRFFYCAKASKSERTCNGQVENQHPTVKSLKLMEYLCILTKTPPQEYYDLKDNVSDNIIKEIRKCL